MGYLMWHGERIPAQIGLDQNLHFKCPSCKEKVRIPPNLFKVEGEDIRSFGPIACTVKGCSFIYLIARGCIVFCPEMYQNPDDVFERIYITGASKLSPVWKGYNERRKPSN